MAISLGKSISAVKAQVRVTQASDSLSRIYEQLSSGMRINRASDDAAGIAISSDLNVKARIFGQAIRNVNDGISVNSIASSAVSALSDITIKLQELASQASNGAYSYQQRSAIDAEAQALADEYYRITRTTKFNGQGLFDGSYSGGIRIQAGTGIENSILTQIAGDVGTGEFTFSNQLLAESFATYNHKLVDLNADGNLDLITAGRSDSSDGYATVMLGVGDGTFGSGTYYATESLASYNLAVGDLNNDGYIDLVTSGIADSTAGYTTVRLGAAGGTFQASSYSFQTGTGWTDAVEIADLNGDGNLDLVTVGKTSTNDGYASVRLGAGDGTFGVATDYANESKLTSSVALADINNDGITDMLTAGQTDANSGQVTVRIGTGDGSFGSATAYAGEAYLNYNLKIGDLNRDGLLDLVSVGTTDIAGNSSISIRLGTGEGLFGTKVSISGGSEGINLADINGDNNLDIISAGNTLSMDGYVSISLGNGDGSFGTAIFYTAEETASYSVQTGDLNGDGVLDIVSAGDSVSNGTATVFFGNTEDGIGALAQFSLKSRSEALTALDMFKDNSSLLSNIAGVLGANMSRLEKASSTITGIKENYLAANSRIMDVDIAQQSANLVRTQILQQASVSILAQANNQSALSLTLLQ